MIALVVMALIMVIGASVGRTNTFLDTESERNERMHQFGEKEVRLSLSQKKKSSLRNWLNRRGSLICFTNPRKKFWRWYEDQLYTVTVRKTAINRVGGRIKWGNGTAVEPASLLLCNKATNRRVWITQMRKTATNSLFPATTAETNSFNFKYLILIRFSL